MKKLLFVLAVLFTTVSSSFAYQMSSLYASANQYLSTQVNINTYCNEIGMQCYFTPDENNRGSAGAYEGNNIVGQFAFIDGFTPSSYTNIVYGYQYWGTVQLYLNNQTSYAYVNLFWQ